MRGVFARAKFVALRFIPLREAQGTYPPPLGRTNTLTPASVVVVVVVAAVATAVYSLSLTLSL